MVPLAACVGLSSQAHVSGRHKLAMYKRSCGISEVDTINLIQPYPMASMLRQKRASGVGVDNAVLEHTQANCSSTMVPVETETRRKVSALCLESSQEASKQSSVSNIANSRDNKHKKTIFCRFLRKMDSTWFVVALAGLAFMVIGTEVPMADANDIEVMSELAITFAFSIGVSLLTSLFAFLSACLAMAAAGINQILASLVAGAARRAILARESVVGAAFGFIHALRSTTVAGILSWMLCLLVSCLLLVLAPFFSVIRRKYFLWRNWMEERLGDFVDFVCVDRAKQLERRREITSRELQHGMQYEHLRPTLFARVAAVVPEEGPVPRLGLWFRLRHGIDLNVYCADQTICRIKSAMARNRDSFASLEQQRAFWSQEIRAIRDQARICQERSREAFRRGLRARTELTCSAMQLVTSTPPTRPPSPHLCSLSPPRHPSSLSPRLPPRRPPRRFSLAIATPLSPVKTKKRQPTAEQAAVQKAVQQVKDRHAALEHDVAEQLARFRRTGSHQVVRDLEAWQTARQHFQQLSEASREQVRRLYGNTSKTAFLRAKAAEEARARAIREARVAAATHTRRSAEAALESAVAEESKARAGWEAARDAVAARRAEVESAIAEETKVHGLLLGTADKPEPSSTGMVKAVVADEPEPSLTGMVKVDAAIVADEPEPSSTGMVKANAADEPEPSSTGKVKADAIVVADEPEPSSTGKVKADTAVAADEPEPSLMGKVKAVNQAETTDDPESARRREKKSSQEQEGTTNAAPLAEPIPEVEQGEANAEPAQADEPEMADASMTELAQELEKALCALTLADEPETVDAMEGLAQEPVKAEQDLATDELETSESAVYRADEPMFESSHEEENEVKDAMGTSDAQENCDQMLVDEPQPSTQQQERAAVQRAAQEEAERVEAHRRAQEAQAQRDEEDRSWHALFLAREHAVELQPPVPMAVQLPSPPAYPSLPGWDEPVQDAFLDTQVLAWEQEALAEIAAQPEAQPAYEALAGWYDPELDAQIDALLDSVDQTGTVAEGGDDTAAEAVAEAQPQQEPAWEEWEGFVPDPVQARMDEFRRRHMHDDDDTDCDLDDEDFEIGAASEGAPEAEPQSASAEEARPMSAAQASRVGQEVPVFDFNFGRAARQPVSRVSQSVSGTDSPAMTASPKLNVEAARAAIAQLCGPGKATREGLRGSEPGPSKAAEEATEPVGATPATTTPELRPDAAKLAAAALAQREQHAGPAERRVLPARGVRVSKEAKQKALQKQLEEEEAAAEVAHELGENGDSVWGLRESEPEFWAELVADKIAEKKAKAEGQEQA
ncbi:hypothetical protein N658DRAFT_485939 [Parathielavia hyrcaniae]|uniref:Uncharacterized protein n=1 Tax=Parathielavia hyrcaniae TaxID=113614 RepID=A0AAN6Q6F3_9PEZI|nr:hypothetical protein N658DRAFT_485939 [Parathielavia hyrcaniae]